MINRMVLEALRMLKGPATAQVVAWRAGVTVSEAQKALEILLDQGVIEYCGFFCGSPLWKAGQVNERRP